MRLSKRHVFTFSVLSLIQWNTNVLNAGTVLNLIETTEAGSEAKVKSAITRKVNMQKLRHAQVERWIEGIKSLSHTQPNLQVGNQSLPDALKDLESLKGYLVGKVKLGEGEINKLDDWVKSQGENIEIKQIRAKFLELRGKRSKHTQTSAKAILEQTADWARLVNPMSFAPIIDEMIAPMTASLMFVATYEEAQHGDEYDALKEKRNSSSQTDATPLTPEEQTELRKLNVLFKGGSPDQMIVRMNQAYSSQELFEYLTNKAARYAVKSILSPVTLPDPAVPNTPAGPTDAALVGEAQSQAEAVAPAAQVGNAVNSDVAVNASAITTTSSSSGGNNYNRKKGGGGGKK